MEVTCGYYLTFAPNPASAETKVSILSATEEETAFDDMGEWKLEVYSHDQQLKAIITNIKSREYRLNTSGWQDGIYIVRVTFKEEILTGKMIVKK